jgi:hypothetical protein
LRQKINDKKLVFGMLSQFLQLALKFILSGRASSPDATAIAEFLENIVGWQ